MSERALPVRIDQMPRKPSAGPVMTADEAIAWALTFAAENEFWKREISAKSIVVKNVRDALRLCGHKIVPMEREDYESRNH